MPGTFGSLAGVLVTYLYRLFLPPDFIIDTLILMTTCGVCFLHIHFYERRFACHDDQKVVIDEVCGQMVTLWYAPPNYWILGIGFILFRFFDIQKPSLIGWIDANMPGAWGTFCDDICAGVAAAILLLGLGTFIEIF